jgi:histidinol-phosphate/aromatic aminotransferase/cobyric acid decarboxylase-like protein
MNAPLEQALARIRPDVRAAHAYVVQPSTGLLKLDAMENPYRLPPELQQALGARLGAAALNRYPAERTAELARALARHAGVPDDCGVTLGNGSDELIGLLTIAVAKPGATVLAPLPGFVMYEAYQPFASTDSLALMARQKNVLVMRTMSKFGLAGVRIGYLLGAPELVDQVEKLRPPYNISVLNAEAAFFALEHADVYAAQAAELRQQRERLFSALQAMPGITPWPSQGNMILARVQDAAATFAALKARGVLIKNVSAMHPLLANCLRFTVGTPAENTLLLQALEACLN